MYALRSRVPANSSPFPVLTWIWTSVSDFRISTAFPFITKLLPEFFRMQEVLDNDVRRSDLVRSGVGADQPLHPGRSFAVRLDESSSRVHASNSPLSSLVLSCASSSTCCATRRAGALVSTSSSRCRVSSASSSLSPGEVPNFIPLATVFYFHNLFLLDDEIVQELLEQLCDLLRDPKVSLLGAHQVRAVSLQYSGPRSRFARLLLLPSRASFAAPSVRRSSPSRGAS